MPIPAVSIERKVARIRSLLKEALELVDQLGDRPVVGARLQHVIDELEADAGARKPGSSSAALD